MKKLYVSWAAHPDRWVILATIIIGLAMFPLFCIALNNEKHEILIETMKEVP